MTSREAMEILKTYRPGVDWQDTAFHEAVLQAKRDPQLAAWLEDQGIVYDTIRKNLKSIPVPGDLVEKILEHRHKRRKMLSLLQLAAGLAALLAVAAFWMNGRTPSADFSGYRASMTTLVSRKYPMSLETPDFERARAFLANNQSPADYVLPPGLKKTPLLGCSTLSWGANPVTLLCFRPADGKDLWLFVTRQHSLPGSPSSPVPVFAQTSGLNTASWQSGDKIYLLASRAGIDRLRDVLRD